MTLVADLDLAEAWHSFYWELLTDQDPPVTLEEITGPRPAWMAGAACRGHPTELFFPGKGEEQGPAKALCEVCPVLVECLAYALARPELRGIWGATGERERVRMRRGG